jgi:hypothetical protein
MASEISDSMYFHKHLIVVYARPTLPTVRSIALLIAAVVTTFMGMSVDAPPIAPTASQPDYTAVMVGKFPGVEDTRRIVLHHGHWTRIETTRNGDRTNEYCSSESGAKVTIRDKRDITLEAHVESLPGVDSEARDTGERQTYLGESCTVWNVWRTRRPAEASNFTHLSCITEDGITLWEKTLHGNDVSSSIEASRIERRPVAAEDVQVPRTLLNLDWWDADLPSFSDPSAPDYERIMELSGGQSRSMRTTRRLGPWQFQDETIGSRRSISITHDSGEAQLLYESDESGAPRLLSMTRPGYSSITASTAHERAETSDLKRSETILGERCRWFDMMHGVYGGGLLACLTRDGIALKEVTSGLGKSEQTWIATHLTRRPIKLDEIKPPAELLDPRRWGID